jgi:hypothetical protein
VYLVGERICLQFRKDVWEDLPIGQRLVQETDQSISQACKFRFHLPTNEGSD